MKRFLLLVLTAAIAAAAFAAPAMAEGNSLGPPGGTIYAFDQAYRTIGTPTSLPDKGRFPVTATTTAGAGGSLRPKGSRRS